MPKSRKAGDLLISDDSKACGQHLWFWRSTGVAVQVGLHLNPVFLLEGVRSLKWKAAPSRKAHSIQTPRIQVNERMLPLSSTRNWWEVWTQSSLACQVDVVGRDDSESWSNICWVATDCHIRFLYNFMRVWGGIYRKLMELVHNSSTWGHPHVAFEELPPVYGSRLCQHRIRGQNPKRTRRCQLIWCGYNRYSKVSAWIGLDFLWPGFNQWPLGLPIFVSISITNDWNFNRYLNHLYIIYKYNQY